jgi:soluble cytochrome b562
MRIPRAYRFLVVALLAGAAVAFARPTQAESLATDEGESLTVETPLMAEMEKIKQAEQFLRRSTGDPAQDGESLKQIAVAQQAILVSKLLPPKMAANVPEAERPKFLAEYRKTMAQLLIEFATLEKALLVGDRDAAKAACKKLHAMEEDGHAEFTDGG